MKKLTILLTALALLLLLCACRDRAESTDGTTESAAAQAKETTTEQTAPDTEQTALATEQTAPDTEAAASDPSDAEGAEESSEKPHALTDNTIGAAILEPTEPTIGLPTPVEPTYEIEDAELPPDDFD